jgi:hypothetical protein
MSYNQLTEAHGELTEKILDLDPCDPIPAGLEPAELVRAIKARVLHCERVLELAHYYVEVIACDAVWVASGGRPQNIVGQEVAELYADKKRLLKKMDDFSREMTAPALRAAK